MIAEKVSAAAGYGGSGAAVASGVAMEVQRYMGMTPSEWQVTGIIGGLVIGFIGMAVNAGINAYFSWRRDQRESRGK